MLAITKFKIKMRKILMLISITLICFSSCNDKNEKKGDKESKMALEPVVNIED